MSSIVALQKSYKKEKLKCLLKTQDHADCTFICGNEKIPAHKLILACSSPVFELMLFGQMAASEVELPDINPDDFRKMLEYVYTDYVNINSVQSAWSLIYISQKYFLSDLLDECVKFVKINLTVSNLLISYEYGQLYNHQELVKLCWQDILRYSKGILFNLDYHMKESTLSSILSQTDINASHSDLIVIAVKWAVEECTLCDKEVTHENIWNIILENNLLKYLNFDTFDASYYEMSDYYDEDHPYYSINYVCDIVKQLKSFYGKELSYDMHVRITPNVLNFKFRDVYRISKSMIFSNLLSLKNVILSNQTIYLFGVAVTTLHRPPEAETTSYTASIRIKVTCSNCVCYNCIIKDQNLEYDHIELINLPMPVKLEGGVSYNLFITYESEPQFERGEVVLQYLSQRVADKKNSTIIQFCDELDGSALRAVSFYPA